MYTKIILWSDLYNYGGGYGFYHCICLLHVVFFILFDIHKFCYFDMTVELCQVF